MIFGSGGLAKELVAYLEPGEVVCCVSTEKTPVYDLEIRDSAEGIDATFLLAVADPEIKKKIVSENPDRWGTFIHPTATVSRYAKVGKGCIIGPQAILAGNPVVGNFVFMNTNATIGHDSTVGDWVTMFPNTEICGGCEIGESCLFGIGSYVLPSKRLVAGVKVSAGSIVRHHVETACTVQGNPAKPRC